MALDRSSAHLPDKADFAAANPLGMNRPPYLTISASSPIFQSDRPCIGIKPHLDQMINLVADTYGPIENYRVLAGNVIGTGGWANLPTEAQYEAVTTTAGAFIASGMMYLEVTGPQAADLLDYLTPRNVRSIAVNRAPFAVFTTHDGAVDEEALILRVSEDRFLVSCGGGQAPSYLPEAQLKFPNVTIRDSELVSFNIKGPKNCEAMATLIAEVDQDKIKALKPFHATQCQTAGGATVTVVRTVIGFEMWGEPDAITDVWKHILTIPESVLPCGWDLLDTYRMECDAIDFLLHPLDMNYATSLFDTGLDWMIDWEKAADFVGKTKLAQLRDAGAALKTVKVVATADRPIPAIGDAVHTITGEPCGHVSSAGYSYSANRPMAYVHLTRSFGPEIETRLSGWTVTTLDS